MAHEEVEAFDVNEYQHGFENLPDGKYLCRLTGLDVKEPREPDGGEASEARWEIVEGPQTGRTIVMFYDLTEYPPTEAILAKNPKAKKVCRGLTALIEDFARAGQPLLDGKERIYKAAIENNRLYLKKLGNESLFWIELATRKIKGGKRKGEDFQAKRILEPHAGGQKVQPKPTTAPKPAPVATETTEETAVPAEQATTSKRRMVI